jgi:hypothetical protein
MAWNPFRAIGNAIRGVFGGGGGEAAPPAPAPAPTPEVAPAPAPSAPAVVPERRGGLAGLWDRVTGADRRREEAAERERQLEERERQVQDRERQVEDRERHIEERERAVAPPQPEAPEGAGPGQAPQLPEGAAPGQAPQPEAPEHDMPKFVGGDGGGGLDYREQDERAFGIDSDIERDLQEAVDNFIADRGGLDGLGSDAREWLLSPSISEVFSQYWHSAGFTAEQVIAGMKDISNIEITEGDDGEIHIEFDYESEVYGETTTYEVNGHARA